jgi:hypothetical protein
MVAGGIAVLIILGVAAASVLVVALIFFSTGDFIPIAALGVVVAATLILLPKAYPHPWGRPLLWIPATLALGALPLVWLAWLTASKSKWATG